MRSGRPGHRRSAVTAAVLGCLLAAILTLQHPDAAGAADGATPPSYSPPVPGAIVDDWRPPAERWGAGNRGVDFDATAGEAVVASADGEVVFAGSVAGSRHVVVLHPDGLRTTYAFLASIAVRRGDRVRAGEIVGTAGGPVHFGVRAGDAYLDPLTLLGTGPPRVHLVDDDDRRPGTVAEERGWLERFVRGSGRLAATGATWARRRAVARVQQTIGQAHVVTAFVGEHAPPMVVYRLGVAALTAMQRPCTPAGVPPPAPPGGPRLLVRVAGFNSYTGTGTQATEAGAIADLDATALGYPPEADVEFSYAGGTTDERPYTSADTHQSIRESGARLAALLDRLAAEHPGVPIDIVAHSMGGLVARTALTTTAAPVRHLVTFGTPHHGADAATAARTITSTAAGAVVGRAAGADAMPSLRDLAEGSDFIRWLDEQPLPPTVRVTSIAARADLLVAVPRAHLDGATNVVVDPGGGLTQHDALPGSPEARRAAALALADAPPPCESVLDALADQATGELVSAVEDGVGAGASAMLR